MTFTFAPKPSAVISSAELADHVRDIAAFKDRIHASFTQTSTGLTLNVTAGEAYIAGYKVGDSGDGAQGVVLAGSSTNHVFVDKSGNLTANTTGIFPVLNGSLKLFIVVTSSSAVTSVDTSPQDSNMGVHINQAVRVTSLTSDSDVNAQGNVTAVASQPRMLFNDTSMGGATVSIWDRNGKLQVTDLSGGTIYVDDLKVISSGGSGIPLAQKGAPNGVATLDGVGVHTATERPTASTTTRGDALVGTANPADITDSTAGVGTDNNRYAREDHAHSHGNRGGGSLHAAATGSVAGFLSSADKTKLDASTASATANTLALRDGSGNIGAADGTTASHVVTKGQLDTNATNDRARANHTGTQLASTVSNFDTQVRTSRLDQMATAGADVPMGSHKITGVQDPGSAQDAATKNYVDIQVSSPFDKAAGSPASAAIEEGVTPWSMDSTASITGGIISAGAATGAAGGIWAVPPAASQPASSVTLGAALTPGDKYEVVFFYKADALPSVTTNISGAALVGTTINSTTGTGNTWQTVANATVKRIAVGFTSAGTWNIYTCDGTTTTTTGTAITYTAGTWVRIKVVFVVGTSAVVTIDSNTPNTVTATLPDRFNALSNGKGTTAASNNYYVKSGAYRFTIS